MEIIFCGGAGEVGASCILLKIGGKNIVLDAGVRIGTAGNALPDFHTIQQHGGADAIIISHAHMDHSGSLPVISREYPTARVYMTHATKDLVRVLLYDSLKIMDAREAEIPVFAEIHVREALERMVCFSPHQTITLFEGITATFYPAGHVAGAVCIYLTGPEGAVFYSGDFSATRQRTVEGAVIPKLRPDVAIFESTYGGRLHADRTLEEDRLAAVVRDTVAAGKKILIPAFALGRAQEVILTLKRAVSRKQMPPVKIFIDGMVKDICRVYAQNPRYLQSALSRKVLRDREAFFDEYVQPVTGKQPQREAIMAMTEGCCIISSSGMLTGGPSQWYASRMAGVEGNYIALTGYQDEESPGSQLMQLADMPVGTDRVLKLGALSIPVQCGIGKYNLSAHADKTEIITLAHALSARTVFFVHGEAETTATLAGEMQREYGRRQVYAPVNGESFIINPATPRKQPVQRVLLSMQRTAALTEEDLPALWDFAYNHYKSTAGFTAAELLYIWAGKNDAADMEAVHALLQATAYFTPDRRRPFIFHAATPEDLAKTAQSPYMEVNQMLALADTYFPPEAGLYRKGARIEEKIVVLYFNFPETAKRLYPDLLNAFTQETGWQTEVNMGHNLAAAQQLVYDLFNAMGESMENVEKISYFPAENYFKARVRTIPAQKQAITDKFTAVSGIPLHIETAQSRQSTPIPVKAQAFQMEQNEAFHIIQQAFDATPDRLYKKSLKTAAGSPYIELSFISSAVGERYDALIAALAEKVRWDIRINPTPNQTELFNTARRILTQHGLLLKKNPAYMPRENIVKIQVAEADTAVLAKAAEAYENSTGIKLVY